MAALLELLEPWVASQTLKMPKVMALKTELFLKGDQSLPDLLGCHLVYLWEYLWGISIYIYLWGISISVGISMAGILLLLVGLVNSKMVVGISMGISMAGSCSSRVICSNGGFLKGTQWEYLWGIYIYIYTYHC